MPVSNDSSEIIRTDIKAVSQDLGKALSRASFWPADNIVAQSAWLEHAPFAFWLIDALRPRTFVELGTHGGFSYFAFCQAVQKLQTNTQCYAVDTWEGDEHSGKYSEDVFQSVKAYSEDNYATFSNLVRSTFDEARSHFSDGTVDLLHIDGRHFFEDVEHDFESWKPKLSDRAVVIFHDTNVRERGFGVYKLWETLRKSYPSLEFLHGYGLGVLGVGKELPSAMNAVFELAKSDNKIGPIREAYARLGATISSEAAAHVNQEILNEKTRELNESARHIRNLEIEIEDKNTLNDSLKSRISKLEVKSSELSEAVDRLQDELSQKAGKILAYEQSRSWRITAPFRFLGAHVRSILKKFESF
ncbi:methyltransferase family protein [Phyllobacterium myrsinacearum]|uniref:class I SAM-dependent methyltransferase n=1 Tax=Phyllobacterium myrsinacearum TaxID=28101 RepID=UPI00102A7D02|nr:class I SAM-dependent methyltransferase [Phyllobacterium myrsinacearum]RZS77656.1 methyltransferase family protein [Phyllobacterium myrsinacearum]